MRDDLAKSIVTSKRQLVEGRYGQILWMAS